MQLCLILNLASRALKNIYISSSGAHCHRIGICSSCHFLFGISGLVQDLVRTGPIFIIGKRGHGASMRPPPQQPPRLDQRAPLVVISVADVHIQDALLKTRTHKVPGRTFKSPQNDLHINIECFRCPPPTPGRL